MSPNVLPVGVEPEVEISPAVESERDVGDEVIVGDDVSESDVTDALAASAVVVACGRKGLGVAGYSRPLRSGGGAESKMAERTWRYVYPVRDPAALVARHEYQPDSAGLTFRCRQNACVRFCVRSDGGLTPISSLVGDRQTTSGAGSASARQPSITSEVSFAARFGDTRRIIGARQTKSTLSWRLTGPATLINQPINRECSEWFKCLKHYYVRYRQCVEKNIGRAECQDMTR